MARVERLAHELVDASPRVLPAVMVLWLPLPYLFGFSNTSYLAIAGFSAALAVLLTGVEAPGHRRTFFGLWCLAFALRILVLTLLFGLGTAAGGPFLGPDSTVYFRESALLADRLLDPSARTVMDFGTYDSAHFYLFAWAVRIAGADLFALQLLNCGFTALVGALTYGWARHVLPNRAVTIGLFVSLFPSLVTLSALDLLKDPAIHFFMSLAVYAIVRIAVTQSNGVMVAHGLLTIVALSYLHMSRFYAAAYIEFAAIGAIALCWWRRIPIFRTRRAVGILLIAIVGAEVIPERMGWPYSPVMVIGMTFHAIGNPQVRQYALGLMDSVVDFSVRAGPGATDESTRPTESVAPGWISRWVSREDVEAGQREQWTSWVARWVARIVVFGANLFRRVFGPFAWILPTHWSLPELLRGDYHLYPGMIVWYAMLPLALLGLWCGGRGLVTGVDTNAVLGMLILFICLYGGQYLVVNLSYRQREAMVPILTVLAFLGLPLMVRQQLWRRAYAAYWVALGLIAVSHLTIRALSVV